MNSTQEAVRERLYEHPMGSAERVASELAKVSNLVAELKPQYGQTQFERTAGEALQAIERLATAIRTRVERAAL